MQIALDKQISAQKAPPETLYRRVPLALPPLEIQWIDLELPVSNRQSRVDAMLQISYDGSAYTFLGEYRANWTERSFQAALAQIEGYVAAQTPTKEPLYPLVILPFLSESHLAELERRCISGLDLCGNGVVMVPKRLFVQRSGQPNRFQIEQTLRNPYRGLASLVPRTLLRRPQFRKLEDLHTEIERRGGKLSLALASRAVQRLQEEVILLPEPGMRIRLVQPDKLLDRLLAGAGPLRVSRSVKVRVMLPTNELLPRLFQAAERNGLPIAMTGIGSVARYASMSMEDVVRVYADDIETLLSDLPTSGERFANLEIRVPHEPLAYFDTEPDERGIRWASPVQTYLEMMQSMDARLLDAAASLRLDILTDLQRQRQEVEEVA